MKRTILMLALLLSVAWLSGVTIPPVRGQEESTNPAGNALTKLREAGTFRAKYRIDVDLPGDMENWEEGKASVRFKDRYLMRISDGAGERHEEILRIGDVAVMRDTRFKEREVWLTQEEWGESELASGISNPEEALKLLEHALVSSKRIREAKTLPNKTRIFKHELTIDIEKAIVRLKKTKVIEASFDREVDLEASNLTASLWLNETTGLPHLFDMNGKIIMKPVDEGGVGEETTFKVSFEISGIGDAKIGENPPAAALEAIERASGSE